VALQNYSENEAVERIYRMLSGGANPEDVSGLLGQMAINEALARIAQLLEGSYGTLALPSSMIADTDAANDGTSNTVALTPYGHSLAHEYGGIYVATGTVSQSLPATTWTKITGAFHAGMEASGEMTTDWNDDRLVLNEQGMWFVHYQVYLSSTNGGNVSLRSCIYSNGTAIPATEVATRLSLSGTAVLDGFAPIDITVDTCPVDIRMYAGSAISVKVDSARLYARKEIG
jgi:hypothetical protein